MRAPKINVVKITGLVFMMLLIAISFGINPIRGGNPPRDKMFIDIIFLIFFLYSEKMLNDVISFRLIVIEARIRE
jgi:hypothetical protein